MAAATEQDRCEGRIWSYGSAYVGGCTCGWLGDPRRTLGEAESDRDAHLDEHLSACPACGGTDTASKGIVGEDSHGQEVEVSWMNCRACGHCWDH